MSTGLVRPSRANCAYQSASINLSIDFFALFFKMDCQRVYRLPSFIGNNMQNLRLPLLILLLWIGVHSCENNLTKENGNSDELAHLERVDDYPSELMQSKLIGSLAAHQLSSNIQTLLYNPKTSSLYVGATNFIFLLKSDQWLAPTARLLHRLNQSEAEHMDGDESLHELQMQQLRLLHAFRTNPHDDHPNCPPPTLPCNLTRQSTINENRALFQIPQTANSLLVACGSAYQGMCFVLGEQEGELRGDLLGSSSLNTNFLSGRKTSLVLRVVNNRVQSFYVATQPDDRPASFLTPTFSARRLSISQQNGRHRADFVYLYNKPPLVTAIHLKPEYQDSKKFPLEYVYIFNYKRYVYLLKNQPVSLTNKTSEARLGRVCLEDTSFFSYTEISISCNVNNAVYGYAMAADFAKADLELKRQNNIFNVDETLYVTFGQWQSPKPKADQGSALCAFSMEQIQSHFDRTVDSCMNGNSVTNAIMPQFVSAGAETCQAVPKRQTEDDYQCQGSNLNHYIESIPVMSGHLIIELKKKLVTSVTTTLQHENKFLVTLIGTEDGHLLKVCRQVTGEMKIISELDVGDRPVVPNSILDPTNEFVFVATGRQVIKYPLASCSLYYKCGECLTVSDTLSCGWINVGGQHGLCATKSEYESIKSELNSITVNHGLSHEYCPPRLDRFHPRSGPISGNTRIELFGEHLFRPNQSQFGGNYQINITVGGLPCRLAHVGSDSISCFTPSRHKVSSFPVEICVHDFTREHSNAYDIQGCSVYGKFKYVQPEITSLQPSYGPIAGGTVLHMIGNHLDAGSSRKLSVNGVPCEILQSNETRLTCRTGALNVDDQDLADIRSVNEIGEVLLNLDGETFKFSGQSLKFEYRLNPSVRAYWPRSVVAESGMNVSFVGRNLANVHNPRLSVRLLHARHKDFYLYTACHLINAEASDNEEQTLTCRIPELPAGIVIPSSRAPLVAQLNLTLDGVNGISGGGREESEMYFYPMPSLRAPAPIIDINLPRRRNGTLFLEGTNLSNEYPFRVELVSPDGHILFCDKRRFISSGAIECEFSSEALIATQTAGDWKVNVRIGQQLLPYAKLRVHPIKKTSIGWLLFWTLVTLALLVGLVLAILCWLRQRGYLVLEMDKNKKLPRFTVSYNNVNNSANYSTTTTDTSAHSPAFFNGNMTHPSNMALNMIAVNIKEFLAKEDILIPKSCLDIGEKLGTGYFGCVYKAVLKLPMQKEPLEVAVKTLKNTNSESTDIINSFLEEALRMKDFKHENVLTLIGVCVKEDSFPMIILPYMANGDLLTYIRSSDHFPTVKHLLYYATDVAKGMSYLSTLKYVHRDLAARNCMMDENLRIKVADFGLTRDVYERNYYTSKRRGEIPIKWMAPECIEKFITTTESDVWSYGILLWELMTRGNNPYPALENYEVLEFLKRGNRMPRPETCPQEVYEIMLDCWQIVPQLRPSFDAITDRIHKIIEDKQKSNLNEIDQETDLMVNYVNYPVEEYYNATASLKSFSNRSKTPSHYASASTFGVSGRQSTGLEMPLSSTPFASTLTLSDMRARYSNLTEDIPVDQEPILRDSNKIQETEIH